MKKLLSVCLLYILAATATYAQWTRLDLPSGAYRDIFFSAEKTGFLVGDSGAVLKTVDDGVTWRKIDVGVKSNLLSVHFPSINVGYIAGDSVVLKTTDGGETWRVQKDSMYAGYKDIVFTTEDIGYLGRGSSRTTDGGKTWTKQKFEYCRGAYFISPAIGYVIEAEHLMKTIDSGAIWTYVNEVDIGVSAIPNCGFFYDELHGLIGSTFLGRMGYTENGGQTWEIGKIKSAYIGYVTDVYSATRNLSYAIGYIMTGSNHLLDGIIKTKDGGKSWTGLKIDTSLQWSANFSSQVYFTDENTGYLVNGQVLKTTTGGEEPVSVQEPLLKTISLNISPNPFKNSARIEFPENLLKPEIRIFTANGEECSQCFKMEIDGSFVVMHRAEAAAGAYFYRIESEGKSVGEGKFVVE